MDINNYIQAWYFRTLPVVDLDNGGKEIPPPTKEQWEKSVLKDLSKLLSQSRKEVLEEVGEEMIWCECGDALYRDSDGLFYCLGCDKYYQVLAQDDLRKAIREAREEGYDNGYKDGIQDEVDNNSGEDH